VEQSLRVLRDILRDLGCLLDEPFEQLAFLPLSVVPHLKITNRGLVDVDEFRLISLDA
jgi:adenine deaminase